MARLTLTAQEVKPTGLVNPTMETVPAEGIAAIDTEANSIVRWDNGDASAANLTVQTPATLRGGLAISEISIAVPAGQTVYIGPFNPQYFLQAAGAGIYIDTDNSTSQTAAHLKMTKVF